MIQLGLVPIVPILLLPFILIFFVIVFPIWGVALGVLGLLLLIARGLDRLASALALAWSRRARGADYQRVSAASNFSICAAAAGLEKRCP
jgi:hypothetical protein